MMEETACAINESELSGFLRKCKRDIDHLSDFTEVHVVIGNVTCDLDSCACSLAYAYLLYIESRERKFSKTSIVIPVLNLKFPEIQTKTEVCYLLDLIGIRPALLVTRTEIDLKALALQKKLKVTLIDHHQLAPSDAHLEESVVRVIDHRPVTHVWKLPTSMVTIEQVGSCSTLVAEIILNQKSDSLKTFPPQVFQLLYGAIILDTMNFSLISKRATEQDVQIATTIQSFIEPIKQMTQDQLYDALLKARCDVSDLSTFECLLKDVKVTCGTPVCTLTTLIQEFVLKPDAGEALFNLELKYPTKGVILIGISMHGEQLKRDIGIFHSSSAMYAKQIVSGLQQCHELNLGLNQIPETVVKGLTIFNQSNQEKTRKHIIPCLQKILEEEPQM